MEDHIRSFAHRRAEWTADSAPRTSEELESEHAWFLFVKALMHRRADLA